MTSNQLVSRQATPSHAPVAIRAHADALLARAKMIASCPPDMLPKHYRGNTGACLLAVDWAERNNVGILEALGEVAFVYGRPVVSAAMQRKLAARAGYNTRLVDSTDKYAIVAVHGPDGVEIGRADYSIELANELGLVKRSEVWKADPQHMLILRATTRALAYYGPADMGPMDTLTSDYTDDIDELPTTTPDSPPEAIDIDPAPTTTDDDGVVTPDGVADPVDDITPDPVDDDGGGEPDEEWFRAQLKQRKIKVGDLVRRAQQLHPDAGIGTVGDITAVPQIADQLAQWVEEQ